MSRLGLSIEGTWLEDCVHRLYEELEAKGIRLRPHVLAVGRVVRAGHRAGIRDPLLSRASAADAAGAEPDPRRRRRHGHRVHAHHAARGRVTPIQHAWQLHRRRKWQSLFGKSSTRYPRWYRPNPSSRRYVQHLRLWYAQAHPDEDFAETFAVWLRPRSDWKRRYAEWPAVRKLEYVDELMQEVGQSKPVLNSRARLDSLRSLSKTLGQHYESRRQLYTIDYPDIYDRDLRRLFSDLPEHRTRPPRPPSFRKNRRKIRAWWRDGPVNISSPSTRSWAR
jgi:hypothetical protein